jgi:hypothetical protein
MGILYHKPQDKSSYLKDITLAPSGFDMISCGPIERKDKGDPLWASRKLAERKLLIQDTMRVQVRTSVEPVEKVPKEIFGRDAEKNDLTECATINDLMFGKGKLTPETCL